MGVSGCGKSTLGQVLAGALHARFVEGDAFHATASVAKMAAGIALDDDDRAAWLATLAALIGAASAANEPLVLACSALKRRYRDQLRRADPRLRFAHLSGPAALLGQRMQERAGHFMPASLLASQLHDLEPLQADEAGVVLDCTAAPEVLVARIMGASAAQAVGPP